MGVMFLACIESASPWVASLLSAFGNEFMSADVVVIIVSYKCAALTIESIRSVAMERSSSGLSIRAIIVDNASGDAPAIGDAVEAGGWSSWVTVHCAPFNGGFAYGNNLGMKL